jgi:hypothetical protein
MVSTGKLASPTLIFTGMASVSHSQFKTTKSLLTKVWLGLFMPLIHKLVRLLLIVLYFMLEYRCFTQVDSDLSHK